VGKPKTLLYLIRTWDLGGSHTIIRLLLRHMPQDQFRIVTVPYDAPGDGNERFVAAVESDGYPVAPERIPWRSRGNWSKARRVVAELIEKYEVDCIHAHDTHSNVLVGIGRKAWPCACVASPYGWWEPPGRIRPRLYHWIEKNLALPNFERVYTVSQDMKSKVCEGRTAPDRIRVIHTGIDLATVDGGAARPAVRAELGIPEDALVVGTVSRLFVEKGHRVLLEAFGEIAAQCPRIRLLIVGTGGERAALEAQGAALGLAQRIHFTGYYEDLAGALRAMDIFAQPSIDHEGFPTALLEAQAAGLPVVASHIGGTNETFAEGRTGLLCPPGDSRALGALLQGLYDDEARRKAMAAAARPWIEAQFTLPDMIAQMSAVYEEAMAEFALRKGVKS